MSDLYDMGTVLVAACSKYLPEIASIVLIALAAFGLIRLSMQC
jgi:hypothetical protein